LTKVREKVGNFLRTFSITAGISVGWLSIPIWIGYATQRVEHEAVVLAVVDLDDHYFWEVPETCITSFWKMVLNNGITGNA
jgi:hypothetical protein